MMQTLPPAMITLLAPFAPLFSCRVWRHALVLVAGALLAPGKRTVCAALRAMGLHQTKHWTRYHRVLNRATWSGLAVSRVLLGLLVATFAPDGPLVVGLDETVERRATADLLRRIRPGAARVMGADRLLHVGLRPRSGRSPVHPHRALDGRALLRGLSNPERPKSR